MMRYHSNVCSLLQVKNDKYKCLNDPTMTLPTLTMITILIYRKFNLFLFQFMLYLLFLQCCKK